MNVFGAFTFGSLIKTFVPGFVWLVALLLLWNDIHHWVPDFPPLPSVTSAEEPNALVLAIPVTILLGLLSNIVVFMGVNDALVRRRFDRRDPALSKLHAWLTAKLRSDHWDLLACAEPGLRESFMDHCDAELLILQIVGVSHLAYVREQYWYHLEFQINLLLAIFAMLVALLASPSVMEAPAAVAAWRAGSEIVVLGGVCWLLLAAARKNYRRHIGKMCSLIAATICEKLGEADAVKLSEDGIPVAREAAPPPNARQTGSKALMLGGLGCLMALAARRRPASF